MLADNPSRRFYERLGGMNAERVADIGGKKLPEWRYGWKNVASFA
ncbi:hypothetical protein [Parageobacillus thermoglucosidasius]|nr:hypothetical protein [Parageobacillus thermoglucosidasius]KYD15044.1 hypothetical protein B4168_2253 [Anoxybacillus flavithermus]MED4903276.1 hypothetical protein [Parageobacillus thermoglucosidasius]MED4914647.1 hypothetical protein [Parageobacillus thermoglucosidasius]MED4946272.1 hypothetical protein [Parageobacillus thermoglucosidasius]MED4982546.1 hypothetical protein [Parageobacillus thermoglucosidasius]